MDSDSNLMLYLCSFKAKTIYLEASLFSDVVTFPFLLAIDGNYTEWSEWSECNVICGGGVHSRSRTCTNPPPKNGGNNCEGLGPANDTQACNPDPCRE